MSLPKFSIAFSWQRSINLTDHPGLTLEKIKSGFEEEIKSGSKRIAQVENGFEFSMRGLRGNTMINPGGSSMPGLRMGMITFTTDGIFATVKCRHVVLTPFYAVFVLVAFVQCYLFWHWHREDFPLWTLAVPVGLLVLYFVFYAISTRVVLNGIWRRACK
jgi:hypothetical protein